MKSDASERGATMVDAVVAVFLAVVCTGLLLSTTGCPAFSRARESARMVQCQSNIRQLGLGLENYNTDFRAMPSVHRNLWWLSGVYLSSVGVTAEGDERMAASDLYRCPSDRMLTNKNNGCSYSPNYEVVAPFAAEPGVFPADNGDARNLAFSPFSNYKLTADANEAWVESPFLRTKSMSASAPSTVFLIENWDADNVVYFSGKGLKGQPPIVQDGQVVCPRAALEDYNGKAAGTTVDGEWLLTPDAQDEWGAFLSLRSFADEAREKKRKIDVDRNAYHGGRINVLFCDQHVETLECSKVFKSQIADTSSDPVKVLSPMWTASED